MPIEGEITQKEPPFCIKSRRPKAHLWTLAKGIKEGTIAAWYDLKDYFVMESDFIEGILAVDAFHLVADVIVHLEDIHGSHTVTTTTCLRRGR